MDVFLTACHILFMEVFYMVIKLTSLSVLYKWCVFSVNCVILHMCVCVHIRVFERVRAYKHIYTTIDFHAGNLRCFLQRKLFNSRMLPNSNCLRETLHCCSRRAARWWTFTPTLTSVTVTVACCLKMEIEIRLCRCVSVDLLWVSLGGNCGSEF